MISLVGYTGFVGSNLKASFNFDGLYNSKNIKDAFGTNPSILYYAGVPAQKFMANKFPHEDMKIIQQAIDNIKKISPKRLVLISTVDVYKNPIGKDEDSEMEKDMLQPYGYNRLFLEEYVENNFKDYLIVRLPGLYGENLKKNFIYDYLNVIPNMLTENKILEISKTTTDIFKYYSNENNGFYKLLEKIDKKACKRIFEKCKFSALNFTDSRGVFQFYNLQYLYKDIQIAIKNNLKKLNISTFPVSAAEIYKTLTGETFINHVAENPPYYDFKTKHFDLYNSQDGYIQGKDFVLNDIKKYIEDKKILY